MRRRELVAAVGVGSVGVIAGCAGDGPTATDGGADADGGDGGADADGSDATTDWPSGAYADYDTTVVAVRSPEGEVRGRVRAAVAETDEQRYLGLSDATSLPEDAGMLFAYSEPQASLTFVMREMDFGIDIVYADAEGTVTRTHNAPEPGPNENGEDQRYPGSGQYVLEVPYEWTDRHGVEVGDSLAFDL